MWEFLSALAQSQFAQDLGGANANSFQGMFGNSPAQPGLVEMPGQQNTNTVATDPYNMLLGLITGRPGQMMPFQAPPIVPGMPGMPRNTMPGGTSLGFPNMFR